MKDVDCSNFVVIIWWAFQWKSLISLKLASKLSYSWVISTDYIRNFIRIYDSNKEIMSSTSKMDLDIFNNQRNQISNFLYKDIINYTDRQEKIILEWIHFSKNFLLFLKQNWARCFWVNNTLSRDKKVILKSITTPITKINNNNVERLEKYNTNINKKDIIYIQKQKEYELFHNIIMQELKQIWIKIVNYDNIKVWVNKILLELK